MYRARVKSICNLEQMQPYSPLSTIRYARFFDLGYSYRG
jgi:hypothetical protein